MDNEVRNKLLDIAKESLNRDGSLNYIKYAMLTYDYLEDQGLTLEEVLKELSDE